MSVAYIAVQRRGESYIQLPAPRSGRASRHKRSWLFAGATSASNRRLTG